MIRFQKIPARLVLGMLALTLIVYNVGGLYLYGVALNLAEKQLGSTLQAIGRTAALHLNEFNAPVLVLCDPATGLDMLPQDWQRPDIAEGVLRLRQDLAAIRDQNNLRNVTVVDRNRVVLADADEDVPSGGVPVALDAHLIERAYTSNTVELSPYYRYLEKDYMRCYAPLVNHEGRPIAVLRISAGLEYFSELHHMRVYLGLISGIGSFLLACVAVALYQLLVNAVRAEQAMADADRLQSLGTLAAGIAHEIRNPLGIIRAIAEELGEELRDDPERLELARDITGEVERLNSMVSQFLAFARPGPGKEAAKPFSLGAVLEDVAQLVRKGIEKEQIDIRCDADGTLPPLAMDEKSIRQVLLNVLLNAREALGREGLIEARLDRAGQFARLRVRDNGGGMDPRDLKRAFDPFFTTKPTGTGLGLSISRNIVERYGGRITLSSERGRGTTVMILLPLK